MTTTFNLSCTICAEDYVSNDEVVSTYCGHLFHKSCFQDWWSRSPTCPECRVANAQTHKLYLHVEVPERRISPQLQVELENKVSRLEHQLTEAESNFFKLQSTQQGKDEEILDLKSEIECQKVQNSSLEEEFSKLTIQLKDSEKNLFDLLDQINKSDTSLKDKDIEIDLLKIQIQNREKEVEALSAQLEVTIIDDTAHGEESHAVSKEKISYSIAELKNLNTNTTRRWKINHHSGICYELRTSFTIEMSLRQRVKVLEEKLRQTSIQLNREIGDSTAQSVELMKLRKKMELSLPNADYLNLEVKNRPDSRRNQSM